MIQKRGQPSINHGIDSRLAVIHQGLVALLFDSPPRDRKVVPQFQRTMTNGFT